MKFPFFKTLVLASALVVAWNCSDETTTAADQMFNQNANQPMQPATNSWIFYGDQPYIIIPGPEKFIVTTVDGTPIGEYQSATGSIVDALGTPLVTGLDLSQLAIVTTEGTMIYPDGSVYDMAGNLISSPASNDPIVDPNANVDPNTNPNENQNTTPTSSSASVPQQQDTKVSSAGNQQQQAKSSSSQQQQQAKSSSSKEQPKQDLSGLNISGSLDQKASKNQSISEVKISGLSSEPTRKTWSLHFLKFEYAGGTYTISGSVPDYINDGVLTETFEINGKEYKFTLTIGNGGQQQAKSSSSQQQQQAKSSSSKQQQQAKSSSSKQQEAKSSSSQQQQNQQSGADPSYKVKNGGKSGNGWGSRYWDCCMPHCAWSGNTGNPTRTCNAQMQSIGEAGNSVCNNGQGGVCDTQAPWAVNDKFAFAFAAVPAGAGGDCGKCYLLTFDGGSHNGGAGANTGGLSGKKMIIMVSNIGGDVQSNQFDIMIPGGGVGAFNGCGTQLGIPSTGAQYGGYITDCNSDPSCVKQKCSAFSKYPKLQAGCEFSADWMGAANNPTFKFEELESCPSEISSRW